ncbi:MAG: histidine kinase [Saprospiraceae bacterium]|nr:histidine kinase [Saprospiraceae bacterium]
MGQPDINIIIICFTLIFLILVGLLFGIVVKAHQKKIGFLLEKQRTQLAFEAEIARTRIEIQEQDLKNISWELHDNIGQLLSVAKLQLTMIKPPELEEDARILAESTEMISDVLAQIRMLSRSLNHEYIVFNGLVKSIELEVERLNRLRFLQAFFKIEGDVIHMEQENEILLFRMVQESMSNVIKHAKATILNITLRFEPRNLIIEIEDNGMGMEPAQNEKGIGLNNVLSRATMLNAQVSYHNAFPHGVKVIIDCPLRNNDAIINDV